MSENQRSSFTGKIGFVLAAAGSAVGLGNIWRFPYLAAKYGGGMFLLTYLILTVTFGFALMVGEIAIGRKTGLSPIGAFNKLNKKYTFLGYIASVIPAIILPYYSIIGGWVLKYMFGFISGSSAQMANDKYFENYIGSVNAPVFWFLIFIIITVLIVMLGVQKGVENVSKFMMPILIVLMLGISIYTIFTVDGAVNGVLYYITPNLKNFSIMTVVAAMGQLFYSMSLAMGIMITFGSYMKKDISIEKSARQVEFFDTGVAFLAGLMIIPAVFAFSGGNKEALNSGPSLMFITLPKIFNSMTAGAIIGSVFFIMVLFAALTSSISLTETIVSTIQDKFKINRKISCLIVLGISILLGLPTALGYNALGFVKPLGMTLLDFFDFISNSILMPVLAFLTCIFIGYVIKPKAITTEVELSTKFKSKKLFVIMIKYIAPIFILLILGSSVLSAFGIISI